MNLLPKKRNKNSFSMIIYYGICLIVNSMYVGYALDQAPWQTDSLKESSPSTNHLSIYTSTPYNQEVFQYAEEEGSAKQKISPSAFKNLFIPLDNTGPARSIALSGETLYATVYQLDCVRIFDKKRTSLPFPFSFLTPLFRNNYQDIPVGKGPLQIAHAEKDLFYVINYNSQSVSIIQNKKETTQISLPGAPYSLTVKEGKAYILCTSLNVIPVIQGTQILSYITLSHIPLSFAISEKGLYFTYKIREENLSEENKLAYYSFRPSVAFGPSSSVSYNFPPTLLPTVNKVLQNPCLAYSEAFVYAWNQQSPYLLIIGKEKSAQCLQIGKGFQFSTIYDGRLYLTNPAAQKILTIRKGKILSVRYLTELQPHHIAVQNTSAIDKTEHSDIDKMEAFLQQLSHAPLKPFKDIIIELPD